MVKWVNALAAFLAVQELNTIIQHHSPIFAASAFSISPHRSGFALTDSQCDPSIVISLRAGTPPRLVPSQHLNKSRHKNSDTSIIEALATSSNDFSENIDDSSDGFSPYFASESVEIPESQPEYTPFDDIVASLASDAHRRYNDKLGDPPPKAPAPLPPPSPKQNELAKYRQGLVKLPFPQTDNMSEIDESNFNSMEWIDGRPDDNAPKQQQKVRYQASLPRKNYHESSAYQAMDWLSGPDSGKKMVQKVRYQGNQSNEAKRRSNHRLPATDTRAYKRDAYIAKSTNSKIGWTNDSLDNKSKPTKRVRFDTIVQKPNTLDERENAPMDWIDGPERGKRVTQKVRFQMKIDDRSQDLDHTQKSNVMDWIDGPDVSKKIKKKVRYELDTNGDGRNNFEPNQNNYVNWADTDGSTNMNENKIRQRNEHKIDVLREKFYNAQKQEYIDQIEKNAQIRKSLEEKSRSKRQQINDENNNARITVAEIKAARMEQKINEAQSEQNTLKVPDKGIEKAQGLQSGSQIEINDEAQKDGEETSRPQPAMVTSNENGAPKTLERTLPDSKDNVSPITQEVVENIEVIEGLKENINSVLDKFDEAGIESLEKDINTVLDKFDDRAIENNVLPDKNKQTNEILKPDPKSIPETQGRNSIASLYQLASRKNPRNTATPKSVDESKINVDQGKEVVQSQRQNTDKTKQNLDAGDTLDEAKVNTLLSDEEPTIVKHSELNDVKKTVSKSKSYIPTVIEEPNAVEEKNNKSNLSVIENKSRSNDHQTNGSLTITKHQLQHTALPSNDDVKVFQTNEEEIVSVLSSTSNTLMEQEQYRQHAKKKKSAYKGFDKILDTQAKVDVEEHSSTVKTYLDKLKKSELELSKIMLALTKSIDSSNEEIAVEESKTLDLINFHSTLEQPDSKIANTVQTLIKQYKEVTNVKKQYVERLNANLKEIKSISMDYRDRRTDLEHTYETINVRGAPKNMQFQWSLLDTLKHQLNDHEERMPFSAERVKVANEQIIDAIVTKLGLLGESLPQCISKLSRPSPIELMSDRQQKQAEFEIRMYEPEKPVVGLKDLQNASDDEILLTISKSAATAAVAGGKTLVFGLKALIDAATKDDVTKAANYAIGKSSNVAKNIYGMSDKPSTRMALPPSKEGVKLNMHSIKKLAASEDIQSTLKSTGETFEALGQAGKAIVHNLPENENSWMTSKAAKDTGKNLLSTFNALVAFGTRQVTKMTNETLTEN